MSFRPPHFFFTYALRWVEGISKRKRFFVIESFGFNEKIKRNERSRNLNDSVVVILVSDLPRVVLKHPRDVADVDHGIGEDFAGDLVGRKAERDDALLGAMNLRRVEKLQHYVLRRGFGFAFSVDDHRLIWVAERGEEGMG